MYQLRKMSCNSERRNLGKKPCTNSCE